MSVPASWDGQGLDPCLVVENLSTISSPILSHSSLLAERFERRPQVALAMLIEHGATCSCRAVERDLLAARFTAPSVLSVRARHRPSSGTAHDAVSPVAECRKVRRQPQGPSFTCQDQFLCLTSARLTFRESLETSRRAYARKPRALSHRDSRSGRAQHIGEYERLTQLAKDPVQDSCVDAFHNNR